MHAQMMIAKHVVHGPSTLGTHLSHLGNLNITSTATPELPPRSVSAASRSDSTQRHYEVECVRDGQEVPDCSHVGEKEYSVSPQVLHSHDHHVDE
jgi:hypothetical protein